MFENPSNREEILSTLRSYKNSFHHHHLFDSIEQNTRSFRSHDCAPPFITIHMIVTLKWKICCTNWWKSLEKSSSLSFSLFVFIASENKKNFIRFKVASHESVIQSVVAGLNWVNGNKFSLVRNENKKIVEMRFIEEISAFYEIIILPHPVESHDSSKENSAKSNSSSFRANKTEAIKFVHVL